MATALIVLAVVGLWVAAVAFGRDSRDGRDWYSAAASDRAPGQGD